MPDTHPGDGKANALERYWTKGPGLALWATHPDPWRTLVALLGKYVRDPKGLATTYYHKVFGDYPGSDTAHLRAGKPIRGKKIGPG